MSRKAFPFGPFSGVYIGDGPPSVAPLTKITEKRTEGGFFSYTLPELWIPSIGNSVPNGEAELLFELTITGSSDQVMRLAMGNSLSDPAQDTPPTFAKYTMLLTTGDEDSEDAMLIPQCYTLKQLKLNREKKNIVRVKLSFVWRDRNPKAQLFKKDTVANLLLEPEMAGRSPF